jgi:hypothetical protein
MKTWIVKLKLDGVSGSQETTIQAKSSSDAKRLIKGQYGDNLKTIYSVREQR